MTVSVVTGSNAGLGLATATGLAAAGHHVVLAVRNPSKGAAAKATIERKVPGAQVEVMDLDLASLASVRSFAAAAADRHPRIDVLVNNAGIVQKTRTVTADGYETTFGVNHLGHFLMTNLLRAPLAAAGGAARVVVVASDAHRFVPKGLDFSDLQSERGYRWMKAYGASKLANILFARVVAERWKGDGVAVNSVHPGFVASRLGRDGDGGLMGNVAMVIGRPFAKSPERGAATSLHLALSPDVAGVTGHYFANRKPKKPATAATDDDAAARLWRVSEELVGQSFA